MYESKYPLLYYHFHSALDWCNVRSIRRKLNFHTCIFNPQWNFIKTKSNIDIPYITYKVAYLPLWIAIICFNGNVSTMYTQGQSNCVPTRTCLWPLGSEGEVVWDIPSVRLQLFEHGLYQTLWLYYLSWKNISIDE